MKKYLILLPLVLLALSCQRPTPQPPANNANQDDYLLITEWDVEFKKPFGMSDLKYGNYSSANDTMSFVTEQLVSLDQSTGGKYCNLGQGPLGLLSRVKNFDEFNASGHFVPENVKIGDYYYYYTGPQATCSENDQVLSLTQTQITGLAETLLPTLRATENSN